MYSSSRAQAQRIAETVSAITDPEIAAQLADLDAELSCIGGECAFRSGAAEAELADLEAALATIDPAVPCHANDDAAPLAKKGNGEATSPAANRLAKKGKARARRSASRGLSTVRAAAGFLGVRGVVAGETLVHESTLPSDTTDSLSDTHHANDNGRDTRAPASWERTTDIEKTWSANRALASFGHPYALTLDLGPSVERAALSHDKGAVDYLRRRITRALAPLFPQQSPPFWFTLETTSQGRLHVHGAIALPDAPDMKKAVTAALCAAGGAWNGEGRQFQCSLKRQHDPDGWAAYCRKDWPRTRRAITGPVMFVPNSLRGAAKAFYETTRQQIITGTKKEDAQSTLTYHHVETFDNTTTSCESTNHRGNRGGWEKEMSSVYKDTDAYNNFIAAALTARDPDAIKIALGELLDVWPVSVLGDAASLGAGFLATGDAVVEITPPTHDLPPLADALAPLFRKITPPSFPTLGPVDQEDMANRITVDDRGRRVLDLDE